MPVCYFNGIYDETHKYNCEYEVQTDQIVVTADYDITPEVQDDKGFIAIGSYAEYAKRDILIVDYGKGLSYLLKDAYYNGQSTVYGNPDGGSKTSFATSIYFYSNSHQLLADLKETPKIRSITILSKDIINYLSSSSVNKTNYEDKLVISLDKDAEKEIRHIGTRNIKDITLQDCWSGGFYKDHRISFDIEGELKLKLAKRVKYTEISKYVYEVYIFLQMYTKRSFEIEEIKVDIDGVSYGMHFYLPRCKKSGRKNRGETSVQCSIMDFLERCYANIPYRDSRRDIRNIPYIIVKHDRNLEDNFLTFYRFIECYYKSQNIPEIKKCFISRSLKENYINIGKKLPMTVETMADEIIALRNHYVHSGYYIKNESLRITFKDTSKNYSAKADVDWIFERTRILYECSIDIIFRNMLKYGHYSFN